ncbi:hypothetical protein PVAP13_9KG525952 [Panicum virgatum]|uniref:Uncharacterized protein n=1 Tax=Panicum virgatum TaxID=38727 RepID=A0A8T0NTX3_PANVG|nr:hypothetical protein PVAP13_9KG525952 [Panicum virgatum]
MRSAHLPLQLMATAMISLPRSENAGSVGYCGFARGQMQVTKVCTGLRCHVDCGCRLCCHRSLFFFLKIRSLLSSAIFPVGCSSKEICFSDNLKSSVANLVLNLQSGKLYCTIDSRLNRKRDLQLAAIGPSESRPHSVLKFPFESCKAPLSVASSQF